MKLKIKGNTTAGIPFSLKKVYFNRCYSLEFILEYIVKYNKVGEKL